MSKKFELAPEAFQFEGKMSLKEAIPLGMQHVLAMFVGNLTPLLIITGACGLSGGEFADLQVSLLQNAMLIAGIVTLIQLFSIGPIGGKVPIIMGTSSGFTASARAACAPPPMPPQIRTSTPCSERRPSQGSRQGDHGKVPETVCTQRGNRPRAKVTY